MSIGGAEEYEANAEREETAVDITLWTSTRV